MDESKNVSVTLKQAYLAMYAYLDELYERTKNDEIACALLDMSFVSETVTFDQASWSTWMRCVQKAKDGEVDAGVALQRPDVLD